MPELTQKYQLTYTVESIEGCISPLITISDISYDYTLTEEIFEGLLDNVSEVVLEGLDLSAYTTKPAVIRVFNDDLDEDYDDEDSLEDESVLDIYLVYFDKDGVAVAYSELEEEVDYDELIGSTIIDGIDLEEIEAIFTYSDKVKDTIKYLD